MLTQKRQARQNFNRFLRLGQVWGGESAGDTEVSTEIG